MSCKSSKSSSDSTFELVDDLNNDPKNILISPSLSSTTSTDYIEDLNEEIRMEPEFREKLDISNVSKETQNDKSITNISSSVKSNVQVQSELVQNSGDNLKSDEFNNLKLQEQLNMQIQSNQNHLELSKQQIQINPQILNKFDQLSTQQLNSQQQIVQHQLNQAEQQQLNLKNLIQHPQNLTIRPQENQIKPNEQSNSNQFLQLNKPVQTSNSSNEIAKLPLSTFDTSSLFGWFSKQDFINKVAENAVNSFNSVLITLDPQMKEIRLSGGPSILVTSNHPFDVNRIRDGFLDTFKRATVKSIDTFLSVETAIQLVGFSTAHKISLERIKGLRSNISIVPQNQLIMNIENFLYNFNDRWFDSDYILLDDPLNKIQLSVHTQGTPIEDKYIEKLKSKAINSKFREDGFSIRIDSLIASDLNCSIGEWHQKYVGFEKSKLHYTATLLLSNLYRNKLKSIGRLNE